MFIRVQASQMGMGTVVDWLKLIRPWQWYKNLVIFAAAFFAGAIAKSEVFPHLVIGFAAFCAISSASYIINDSVDAKADREHDRKKERPIASGRITLIHAGLAAIVLLVAGFALIWIFQLRQDFAYLAALLFVLMQVYNFALKNIAFADVNLLASNFLVRAYAGGVLAGVDISPWFVLGIYTVALFLALAKRRADLFMLGNDAAKYKPAFKVYDLPMLDLLIGIVSALMLAIYALYSFQSPVAKHPLLLASMPLVFFAIFRYLWHVKNGGVIAREPELAFKDMSLVIAGIAFALLLLAAIYF